MTQHKLIAQKGSTIDARWTMRSAAKQYRCKSFCVLRAKSSVQYPVETTYVGRGYVRGQCVACVFDAQRGYD